MDKIENFFHNISPKIIALTKIKFKNSGEVKYKGGEDSLDISTDGDTDNEKLIKDELNKWFPEDNIVAEETSTDTTNINQGRVWIIDPICGSGNFKNGIKFFSTNIALANNGKLIASLVVDHSREEYIWSVGNSIIYINKQKVEPIKTTSGTMIEVDISALVDKSSDRISKLIKLVSYLLDKKKYYLTTFCTSLPFAYVSLGRVDAYVNGFSNVWDVAAANFLIQQAGGNVTELDGKPWTLNSDNVLASFKSELHQELLSILNS
jgi:myo-inositol-1(or 4)-monophosphatase